MFRFSRPLFTYVLLASASGIFIAADPAPVFAEEQTHAFDIRAQPLASALLEYSRQSEVPVVVSPDLVAGKRSPGVKGALPPGAALDRLLTGTGLVSVRQSDGGVTFALSNQSPIRLGDAGQASPSGSEAEPEEIVVTAQKREERLRDVPVPVTVLNADNLADNGQPRLRDFFAQVPGINVMPSFVGTQNVSIRGVTTGGLATPTVGVTIDDVPVGASSGPHGNYAPDIDPGDLARIEVLRGPQGTLYGANSMGGLIKFATVDPSTNGYNGRVEAGISGVYNGAEPGYNLRGSVNVPLGDTLAIRASAFSRQDPGYIDNPVYHLKSVNDAQNEGARLSAMWRPSEDFSVKLSALYQHTRENGLDEVDIQPGLTDLQQNYLPGSGNNDITVQAYSAIVKARLGSFDLTSVTGYNVNRALNSLDWGFTFSPGVQAAFGVTGALYHGSDEVQKFVQELRLSGTIGDSFEWLIGGFYTHEDDSSHFEVFAENTNTGQINGQYWRFGQVSQPDQYDEYAAFTNLTYHITDDFDVQIGGRESHLKVSQGATIQTGPLVGGGPVIGPKEESSADAFTYLATPRYKLSPDLMVYARFASGYRPGTPNLPAFGVTPQSNPDQTRTYEVGMKGDFVDHRFSVDASIYHIDWTDIQIQLRDPVTQFVYNANGSGAKSDGVELSFTARPLSGLTISGWFDYDDAVLTKAFSANTPSHGVVGDRLPLSSRYSGNLSVEEEFPLWADTTGFVGGQISYVGDRVGVFTSSAQRQDFPSYTKTDLHAGVKYESWTASAYVNNATDERALTNGGIGYFYPPARIYITPQTVGLTVVKTF